MSMRTNWAITVASEQLPLDDQRSGETTFTVTNPDSGRDTAVFAVVADASTDKSWFTIDEPQRRVDPGASESFLLKIAVPAEVPAGTYEVQCQVSSVHTPADEWSVLSPRLKLEVPAAPEPAKRRLPKWWPLAAAGLALLLLIVVAVLAFSGGDDDPPEAAPSANPAATPQLGFQEVAMPDLVGSSEREALQVLAEAGLTAQITYLHDPERAGQVVEQWKLAGEPMSPALPAELEVAVEFSAPTVTGPAGTPFIEDTLTLEWSNGAVPATKWVVTWSREMCRLDYDGSSEMWPGECWFPDNDSQATVEERSFTPDVSIESRFGISGPNGMKYVGDHWELGTYHTGWVRWQVAALDGADRPGIASEPAYFRLPVS